ncbi:MAG: TM2 domain-containing protein [Clostridia bacterium]|nr:TM2 domain-containing protein [Clostridia bacterium]
MKFCEKCGAELDEGAQFCTSCGAALATDTADKYEKVEAETIPPTSDSATYTNQQVPPTNQNTTSSNPNQKSKIVAGLLGIFLGSLGIHRFYLGYTGIGIVQIIVTIVTCGLGSLWGFIEGILILCGVGSYTTDADGNPLGD